MKQVLCLMGVTLALVGADAYEYPSVSSVADIQKIYLKTPDEIIAHKEKARAQFHHGLETFLKIPVATTASSHILQSFDQMIGWSEYFIEAITLFSMVEPNDSLREVYALSSQELKQDYIQTMSDTPALYKMFAAVAEKEAKEPTLSYKEAYYLKNIMKEMELAGLHLSDGVRLQVKTLKMELTTLSEQFGRNIQEDQSRIVVKGSALAGVEASFLKQLNTQGEDEYVLTCDYPTYFTIMRSCDHEETRKALYRAFANRAYPNNIKVLHEMIAKRDQLAKLLGYGSFAEYQLSHEMVKSPAAAEQFLEGLMEQAVKKQTEELKTFKEVVPSISLTPSGKIDPWNSLYAQQKVKEIQYNLNQDLIKEYFPLETTIQGLIWVFESFFDLHMTTESVKGLWHEDIKLLKVADKHTQKVYGYVLLDLFPRPNKYSHACHGTIMNGIDLPDGTATTSLSLVIANFPKPAADRPSLMSLSDVKTFFHELGHGIHAIMGRTQFAGTSGTHVKVDFVELPSQMLEEWLCEAEVLKKISSHYQTKQPLPEEWIEQIQNARSCGTGQFIGGQGVLSKFALSCFASGQDKDTSELLKQLHNTLDVYYTYDKDAHTQASFGHLDEYGARYYGYLWSRVFAVDVFEQIKKEGLLNPKAGARYLKEILGQGGSEDPEILLKSYLGREPSQEAFLRVYGITK